jgi:hypothetical protein
MIEVRGKFLLLAGGMMTRYPGAKEKALRVLMEKTGQQLEDVDPDGWYDSELYQAFLDAYCDDPEIKEAYGDDALVSFAKAVFPTLDLLEQVPAEAKETPLDLIRHSTQSFADDHRGEGIRPIEVIKAEEGDVLLDIPYCGYDCTYGEGVYLGILEMLDIENGEVEQTKCYKKGDPSCMFHITWS